MNILSLANNISIKKNIVQVPYRKTLCFTGSTPDINNTYAKEDEFCKNGIPIYLCNTKREGDGTTPTKRGQIILDGTVFNRHKTCYARDDVNWIGLGGYLKKRFQSIENVDINIFGCSTGEEPYTLTMLLKKEYKEAPFKIQAYDIDENIIKTNILTKERGVETPPWSVGGILARLKLNDEDKGRFFIKSSYRKALSLQENVTQHVEFNQGNILESLDKIKSDKPSIIFCRNMWPYIDPCEYDSFAKNLYEKLAPGSIVVIGEYDLEGEEDIGSNKFPEALLSSGFKNPRTGLKNDYIIFEKN